MNITLSSTTVEDLEEYKALLIAGSKAAGLDPKPYEITSLEMFAEHAIRLVVEQEKKDFEETKKWREQR
ncbi:hypothetical protein [Sporosarcina cascadiensis]|uniref:hypothetical protein n=1 Tax=Sporosarcina cascadiensis TaxID=2660747 RepID=UPI00129BC5D8|nr:hypothetical protein [Sporosarcina cascadiensis]